MAGARIMPVGYAIGDHRLFALGVLTESIVGTSPPKIVRPAARRLNTKIEDCLEIYKDILEDHLIQHKMLQKLKIAHEDAVDQDLLKQRINKVDEDAKQYMKHMGMSPDKV